MAGVREGRGGGGGGRGSHSPFSLWGFLLTTSSSSPLFRLPLTLDKTRTKVLLYGFKNLLFTSQAGAFVYFFSKKSLLNQITRQDCSVVFYHVYLTSGQEAHPL